MSDFLFDGDLADIDPDVSNLACYEAERQYHKLVMIPSESSSPIAVRNALSTAFHNIYAEGYPAEDTRWMNESEILLCRECGKVSDWTPQPEVETGEELPI